MEGEQINHSKLVRGFFVGSLLGAAAGFLLAPKSGKELRSDIKTKSSEALDETKRLYSEGRTKFENVCASIAGKRKEASLGRIESPEEIMGDA